MAWDRTGTVADAEVKQPDRAPSLALQLVLCGEKPLLGGRAFDLAGVREVIIGRGVPLSIGPGEAPGQARLELPDPAVSGRHARLELLPGQRARLTDLGSRNGTRPSGERAANAELGDGDWFMVGRTVLAVRATNEAVPPEPAALAPASPLRTFVPAFAQTLRTAAALAPSTVPMLLLAETGTGKEVLARELHAASGRPGKLVAVNCAALPETLVESELFGYRRGAFSEAREDRPGLVRAADSGTLLLDEVGDLPLGSQAKLLRVLQEGEVLALGSTTPMRVDVRVLAATQRRLDELVADGRFRVDLLGRLAGYTLTLPPLRERRHDLGLLVAALLERHAGPDAAKLRLSAEACTTLMRRRFSLNVRELERTLQSAIVLARAGGEILNEHLGTPPVQDEPDERPEPPIKGPALRERLVDSLTRHGGNVSAVAREFGKARMQIHRWMDQLGLDVEQFRKG